MNKSSFKHRMKSYALVIAAIGIVGLMLTGSVQVASASTNYTYKVSGTQVLNSAGSVAYTGSSFTTALNWAVGHANSVTYVPAGTYTLTSNINFAAGTSMFGDGDTTIFTSTGVCSLRIADVSNVALSSFMMTGSVRVSVWADSSVTMSNFSFTNINGKSLAAGIAYGFWVYASSSAVINGVVFTSCTITNSACYGFCLNGGGQGMGPYNELIENVQFTNCKAISCGVSSRCNDWVVGFDLAETTNVQNIVLTNCEADYSFEAGFHFENFPAISGISFVNCVANYNGQKPATYKSDDGSVGPLFGTGFFFDTAQIPKISFQTCSGVGNSKGLSIISRTATTLNTVTVTTAKWAPTFTNSPSTTGTIGLVYSYTPSVNESSTLTLVTKPTWASWSGSVMSGTPTAAGSYSFAVKATSARGTLSTEKDWTVVVPAVVIPAKWAPTFTNSPSTTGTIGSVYSYTPSVNESSTLTLVTKPTWASWSGSVMSGTPTAAGSYSFSIKATSNAGTLSSWKNWTVSVPAAAPVVNAKWAPTFTNSPSTTGTIGSVYSYTPSVNESSTLAPVTKPTWASWSGSVMSGTPTAAGSYSFAVKATSNAGTLSSWKNWTVSVPAASPVVKAKWAPLFTNSPSKTGRIGSLYSYTPTLNESSTLTLVSKPLGTTWSGTTISGMPMAPGTYFFSIKATSNAGTLSSWMNWTVTISYNNWGRW